MACNLMNLWKEVCFPFITPRSAPVQWNADTMVFEGGCINVITEQRTFSVHSLHLPVLE